MIEPVPGLSAQIYYTHSGDAVFDNLEHKYLAMMPTRTRASIQHYKRSHDRWKSLAGKLLLLRALRIHFHDFGMQKFQSLEITEEGKPFIKGCPGFNISHSGEMVVLAITTNGAVGVDVEKVHYVKINDFAHSLPEVANLHEDNDADTRHFFDCWTQKEAVLKGSGKGLLAPLEHVTLQDNKAFFYGAVWFIKKLQLAAGYCCHIATDQPVEHVFIEHVDLMNDVF